MSEILGVQRGDATTNASKNIKLRKEQVTTANVLKGVLRDGEVIFSTAETNQEENCIE